MDCREEVIGELLRTIISNQEKHTKLLEKIYVVFSKYDEEFQQSNDYLLEIKKDGNHFPQG